MKKHKLPKVDEMIVENRKDSIIKRCWLYKMRLEHYMI